MNQKFKVTARVWDHELRDYAEKSGTIELTINIEKVAQRLGAKALRNKTGISREFNGLLHARVIK